MLVIIGGGSMATNTNNEGGEAMALVDTSSLIYNEEKVNQAINTKEHYEILNSLFQGNHLYEEKDKIRKVALAKIVDMI